MRIELYEGTKGEYYACFPGAQGALLWRWEEDRWTSTAVDLPEGSEPVALAELPPDLREELLAFAARAEALGNQLWVDRN